jgi:hypothetical protein
VGTSLCSLQLGFNLVCELPQVGDGSAQIGKRSMDGAGVSTGAALDLDADAL